MGTIRLTILLGFLAGCASDQEAPCQQAYVHLVEIAKQEEHLATRERFVKACVEAYDEGRIRCLLDATTTDDALACRAGRVPPG
tara:strand:+ start:74 stop:325 length:252 start_codon:yes stop_codon:yes gene_type:complete